jgi:hypothetical protein
VRHLQEHLPHLAEELREVEERIEPRLPPGIRWELLDQERLAGAGARAELRGAGDRGGGEASQQLYKLLRSEGMKSSELRRLRRDLLKYCKLDTLALVQLHRKLP